MLEIGDENFIQIILIYVCLWVISWPFSTQVRKWTSLQEALRKREIDCTAYCSNFGFRSLCLSGVLVAVIIKICCDLRPTNSFCCFLFQPFPTARIVPHLTEPLAHFSHSHSTSLRSRPHSFSLLQNYDFLVHAHLVLDFFFLFVSRFKDHHVDLHDSRSY